MIYTISLCSSSESQGRSNGLVDLRPAACNCFSPCKIKDVKILKRLKKHSVLIHRRMIKTIKSKEQTKGGFTIGTYGGAMPFPYSRLAAGKPACEAAVWKPSLSRLCRSRYFKYYKHNLKKRKKLASL